MENKSRSQSWRGVVRNNTGKWEKAIIFALYASFWQRAWHFHGAQRFACSFLWTHNVWLHTGFPQIQTKYTHERVYFWRSRHPVWRVDNFPELMCILVILAGSLLIWKTEVKYLRKQSWCHHGAWLKLLLGNCWEMHLLCSCPAKGITLSSGSQPVLSPMHSVCVAESLPPSWAAHGWASWKDELWTFCLCCPPFPASPICLPVWKGPGGFLQIRCMCVHLQGPPLCTVSCMHAPAHKSGSVLLCV